MHIVRSLALDDTAPRLGPPRVIRSRKTGPDGAVVLEIGLELGELLLAM